jgi:hypothetical protein
MPCFSNASRADWHPRSASSMIDLHPYLYPVSDAGLYYIYFMTRSLCTLDSSTGETVFYLDREINSLLWFLAALDTNSVMLWLVNRKLLNFDLR